MKIKVYWYLKIKQILQFVVVFELKLCAIRCSSHYGGSGFRDSVDFSLPCLLQLFMDLSEFLRASVTSVFPGFISDGSARFGHSQWSAPGRLWNSASGRRWSGRQASSWRLPGDSSGPGAGVWRPIVGTGWLHPPHPSLGTRWPFGLLSQRRHGADGAQGFHGSPQIERGLAISPHPRRWYTCGGLGQTGRAVAWAL